MNIHDIAKLTDDEKRVLIKEGPQPAWEVTPNHDSRYDSCVFFVAKDPDGRKAMEYAQEVIESLWDGAESLDELDITVRLRRTTINAEDVDYGD